MQEIALAETPCQGHRPARNQRRRQREDLLQRLSVFVVDVPPLREHLEDLESLVSQFIAEFNARSGKHVQVVPPSAWQRMREYDWPGNVRELRNVVERSVLLADGATFPETWLPTGRHVSAQRESEDGSVVRYTLDGEESLDQLEERVLRAALEQTGGNVAAAARLLGITRQTLRYRLEKYGVGGSK